MHARPLDAFAATLVFALCIVWGFNQVAVKLALPDVGPIAQTGIRSGIGALCVIAYAVSTKRRIFEIDGTEAAGALAGALFTAEFIALYESLRFTTAARATVFLYAAPFLVALGAAFLIKDERLRPIQWVGLAFAFLGVVCGFVGRTKGGSLAGDALAFLAAALWAATTLVIKATPLRRIDPMKILLYQIGFAALIAPLVAYAFGEAWPTQLTTTSVAAAPLARRRCGRGQLRALVLDAHPLRRGRAFGLHLHHPAGRRARRLARVRRDSELGVFAGDRAGHCGSRARQLAARRGRRVSRATIQIVTG